MMDSQIQSSISTFFATLTPDNQALFKATTLSAQLLEVVQNADKKHQERSYSRRATAAIRPFVAGVEHYGQAWDVMSNTASVLTPIWGSARVILTIATDFGDYFDNLSGMFSQIGRHLMGIRRYPTLYPDNEILQTSMVEVFRAIFEFLTRAAKVFRVGQDRTQGGIRTVGSIGFAAAMKIVWKPFKAQFGDIIDRILRCMEDIETEVEIAEKELASKERRDAEAERQRAQLERELAQKERAVQARERFRHGAALALVQRTSLAWSQFVDEKSVERLNGWLAPVNVASNHNAATKARHADSGRWFLEGHAFQQWLKEDNSFLWLHAIPGAGKTVLTSTVINYLREHIQSPQVGLVYFYCDYRETPKQQPLRVLSTILNMLSIQNRQILHEIQAFFQEQHKLNPVYVPEFDELLNNFGTFIRNYLKNVIVVVDALDECIDRDCTAYALKHIFQNYANVKVFATSRNEIDIARSFDGLPRVSIEQEDVAPDIENYIKAELTARIKGKKLKLRDATLAEMITQRLVEGAKGMFQWAKCQIDQLCKLRNDKAIREALKDLPKTLHETYIRILKRIQEQSEDDILSVQRVLRWLVKGARNMSLGELAECISIDPDDDEDYMEFDAVITDPEDILELCSSLVSVSADGFVAIAHYSAKEFLISDDLKGRMPDFWVGGYEVETELATVCLKYLCFKDFGDGALTNNDEVAAKLVKYNALEYVSRAWAIHAHRSERDGHQAEPVVALTMRLFSARGEAEERQNFELWKQVYYYKTSSRNSIPRGSFHPLHCGCYFGLTEAVEQLLVLKPPDDYSELLKVAAAEGHISIVKSFLGVYRARNRPDLSKVLYAAAARGRVEIVQLLLQEGIDDINARGGKDGTAIQAAALEGRYEVVSLLLDHGAVVKFPCKRWGTPLAAAAEKGHLKTVQTLLDRGANPNGRGGWYSLPLVSAVVGKNSAVIDLLLERGADINAQGGRHGSALMAAASLGMIDLVSKLVDKGAKVNDEDDKGSDALYAACVAGHLDIVNILLDLGADVNAKGGKHRNALNAASAEGRTEIVRRLIDAGANVDIFDEHYGNALQVAAYKGREDILQILADAGADVNAEGGDRGTALVAAASAGHENVVRLLFELGVTGGETDEMATALVFAADKGHKTVVPLLIEAGANLYSTSTMVNPPPRTPLEAAASNGHLDIVELLLEEGADINYADESSSLGFPLLAAVSSSNPSVAMITAILDAGADPNTTVASISYATYGYALPAAVVRQNLEIVQLLVDRGADVNLLHENYHSPLQLAAGLEDTTILEFLLSCGGDVNGVIGSAGYERSCDDPTVTPLQQAAFHGQEDHVRRLVGLGAVFSVEDDNATFKSALQAAASQGHVSVVRALVELGGDVNEIGGDSGTSLIAAATHGHIEVLEALIDAGADVNTGNVGLEKKQNALIAAAGEETDVETIRFLIKRGADPNKPGGGQYQYPLHCAAAHDHDEPVRVLIELGADVNAKGGRYMTALQAACVSGNNTSFVLLELGADPNIVGGQYGTALAAAYVGGFYEVIGKLYRQGADNSLLGGSRTFHSAMGAAIEGSCDILVRSLVFHHSFNLNMAYGRYDNALQHAVGNLRSDSIFSVFIAHGSDANKSGGRYGSALTAAALRNRLDWVQALLEAGADFSRLEGNPRYPNALYGVIDSETPDLKIVELLMEKGCDVHGQENIYGTPVQRAAYLGHFHIVRRLIKSGADPDAFPSSSRYGSGLQAAALRNQRQLLRYLVHRGSNVKLKGGRLGSPLNAAVLFCSLDEIELLLQKGADPNQRCGRYCMALQAAAAAGRPEVVLLLLRYGANINAIGGRYGTALQAAVVSGNRVSVDLLLERGADPNIEAGWYRTALQAAVLRGDEDMARYLIDSCGAAVTLLDRTRLAHRSESQLDDAEEVLKSAQEPEPDEDEEDKDGDEEEEEEAKEAEDEEEEAEDEEDEEEEEEEEEEAGEEEDEPPRLQLNVTSIPDFEQPYFPNTNNTLSHSELKPDVDADEANGGDDTTEQALELYTAFSFDIVDAINDD